MKSNPTELVQRGEDGAIDISFYLARGRQARSEGWGRGMGRLGIFMAGVGGWLYSTVIMPNRAITRRSTSTTN